MTNGARRTRSQPECSSKSIVSASRAVNSARRRSRSACRSRSPSGSPSRVSLDRSNVARSCGSGTSSPANAAKDANSRRRPSRVATAISSSMWSLKNWNGARSPCSSPWKIIGANGDSSVQSAASARTPTGSRSPSARLPIWSWLALNTTKRSGARSPAGAPKRRWRNAEYVPSCTCGRRYALASSASSPNSPYQPSRSPVSSVRSAWWKSSAQAASQPQPPPEAGRTTFGAVVADGVDGVEPQPVEVEVAQPLLGALERPLAHRVAVRVVVVDRLAPHRLVLVGEVRAEGLDGRRARRADVVVDDVEDHGEALAVRRVDELGEPGRATVGRLRGGDVDAVVAPAVAPGELADGHQLDRRHAEVAQAGEVRDGVAERPARAERADVQLVDHGVGHARRHEGGVGPLHDAGVEQARRPAQPLGLEARARVREGVAVEHEPVVRARLRLDDRLVDAVAGVPHLVLGRADAQPDVVRPRGPHPELGAPVAERERPEPAFERKRFHCAERCIRSPQSVNFHVTVVVTLLTRGAGAGRTRTGGAPRLRGGRRRPRRRALAGTAAQPREQGRTSAERLTAARGARQRRPSRSARAASTASLREVTWSLRRMLLTCERAVACATTSASAISAVERSSS